MPDTTTTQERTAPENQHGAQGKETPMAAMPDPFDNVDVIYTYSRAQAISDGTLVDVSETAREAGFKVPTVLTQAVWNECVEWSDADNERQKTYQDQKGRLWDVLWMASNAMRATARRDPGASVLLFKLLCVPRSGTAEAVEKELKVMIHGGDSAEVVATILLPNED